MGDPEPVGQYQDAFPHGYGAATVDPVGQKYPAEQGPAQALLVTPGTSPNLPAGHCAGTTVPLTQKVPTGQAAVQALVSMLALLPKRPPGQGVGMADPASQ